MIMKNEKNRIGGIMEKSTKKFIFLILIIFQFLSLALFGSTIEYKYYFKKPQITKQGDYHRIEMDGLMSISKPGEPELPCKSVQLLLPPGEQAVSISVFYKGKNDLPGEFRVYPRQRPYPIGYQGKVEFTEPNPEIYNSDKPFPGKLHTEIQTQYLRGHSIAILNIFPVRYIPALGEISYFSEMKVVIETEPIIEAGNSFNNFYRNDKVTNGRVRNIVHNPEQIGLYPSQLNTRSGDNKYVIITGNSDSSYFASFADFKTKQGYNVLIKTVEDIYSDPAFNGVDTIDEIRNFIKYAYQNLGTEYVLLGGDVEIVPHRGFWINTGYGTEDYDIPADLYYAALDRVGSGTGPDWNTNNNSKWGETSEADYYAEVYIGRISADTGSEFSAALNKQMMYQQSPVAADLEKAIMVGEELNDDPQTWGGTYKDEIMYGGTYNGYTTTGFPGNFTVQTQYERDGSWSWTDLKNKMNAGTNIINHLGHSNPDYNMQFYRSYVTNTNLTSNGTNHNFYIIYTQGCTTTGFDNRWPNGWYDPEDCIGEKFTTISNGCVAYIGNSRYGWYNAGGTNSSSQYLDRQFFDALFGENIYKLGEMNEDSKEDGASKCNSDPWYRWSYYCVNLLGDPSLDVWTDAPATLAPTYADSIYTASTQLTVSVGVSGALVGLSQNGNHIGSGITNGTGNVIVIFDNSPSAGTMDIYITAHNYYIHTDTITVSEGSPPNPPTNLFVTEMGYLTWDAPIGSEGEYIHWDSGQNQSGIGLTNGGNFMVAARWNGAQLAGYDGWYMTKVNIFPRSDLGCDFILKVWTGPNAGTIIVDQPLTSLVQYTWNEVTLSTPVLIDASDELWVGYAVENQLAGDWVAGCDDGPVVIGFGDMWTTDGVNWVPLSDYGYNINWNIQAWVQAGTEAGQMAQPIAQKQVLYNNASTDITVGKLNPAANAVRDGTRSLLGYKVYLNGGCVDSTTNLFWQYTGLTLGVNYTAGVSALYSEGESAIVEYGFIHNNGLPSSALQFDGTDDYAKGSNFNYPATDLTLEAWIKPDQFGVTREVIYGINPANYSTIQFRINGDGSLLYGESPDWTYIITPAPCIELNEWNHIAMVRENGLCKLYVNGVQLVNGIVNEGVDPTEINIGGRVYNMDRFYSGDIDEVRIWAIARTQSEIQDNMTCYLEGTETGLITYWQMNEGTGQIAFDLTGNGYDLQLGSTLQTDTNDPDWITSTAPIPYYYTISNGNWETNSIWASGQNAPEHTWSRVRIEHNITINSTIEVIKLKLEPSGTLTITTGYQVTVSGD